MCDRSWGCCRWVNLHYRERVRQVRFANILVFESWGGYFKIIMEERKKIWTGLIRSDHFYKIKALASERTVFADQFHFLSPSLSTCLTSSLSRWRMKLLIYEDNTLSDYIHTLHLYLSFQLTLDIIIIISNDRVRDESLNSAKPKARPQLEILTGDIKK